MEERVTVPLLQKLQNSNKKKGDSNETNKNK